MSSRLCVRSRSMATLFAFLLSLLVGCGYPPGESATPEATRPTAPFDGVFQYMLEGREGLSFYQEGYFVHFLVPEAVRPAGVELTEARVTEWWTEADLESGTYTVSGDTTTCTFLFHRNPSRVGESFRWVGGFSGDTLTWRVLDEQGAVTTVGRSLRLR